MSACRQNKLHDRNEPWFQFDHYVYLHV